VTDHKRGARYANNAEYYKHLAARQHNDLTENERKALSEHIICRTMVQKLGGIVSQLWTQRQEAIRRYGTDGRLEVTFLLSYDLWKELQYFSQTERARMAGVPEQELRAIGGIGYANNRDVLLIGPCLCYAVIGQRNLIKAVVEVPDAERYTPTVTVPSEGA
jgi:hypothetical protein